MGIPPGIGAHTHTRTHRSLTSYVTTTTTPPSQQQWHSGTTHATEMMTMMLLPHHHHHHHHSPILMTVCPHPHLFHVMMQQQGHDKTMGWGWHNNNDMMTMTFPCPCPCPHSCSHPPCMPMTWWQWHTMCDDTTMTIRKMVKHIFSQVIITNTWKNFR